MFEEIEKKKKAKVCDRTLALLGPDPNRSSLVSARAVAERAKP